MSLSIKNIPSDWELKEIGDIADVKGGKRLPKGESLLEEKNSHPYIRVADMFMGGVSLEKILYVPENIFPIIKNYIIKQDDLFISVAGTLGVVGEIPIELDGGNLTENANKLTNIKINKSFLLQILLSPIIQNAIEREKTNNAQPKLALTRIRTFKIPIPPLQEQQKIAEILSTVDAKISIIDEQISETQNLKKGLMQSLLSKGIGHTEFKKSALGEIPKSWEVLALSDFTDEITDYVASGSFASLRENVNVYTEPNYAIYVRLTDLRKRLGHTEQKYVDKDSYNFLSKSNLSGREILFANIGANVGEVWMMPQLEKKATVAPNMIVIRANNKNIISEYLHAYLSSSIGVKQINKIIAGSGHPKINKTDLRCLLAILPPLKEQQKIASILSSVDEKLGVLSEKKSYYQNLKKGLMQQLLTGKVRVSV